MYLWKANTLKEGSRQASPAGTRVAADGRSFRMPLGQALAVASHQLAYAIVANNDTSAFTGEPAMKIVVITTKHFPAPHYQTSKAMIQKEVDDDDEGDQDDDDE
jgi:hypothetical protein